MAVTNYIANHDFTSISFSPEVKVLTALACSYVAGNILNYAQYSVLYNIAHLLKPCAMNRGNHVRLEMFQLNVSKMAYHL